MKIAVLFICLIFATSFSLYAQSRLYIGAEANFIRDLYTITDEGNALGAPNFRAVDIPGTSLLVGYQLSPIFSVETGIATRPVKSGYRLSWDNGSSASQSGGLFYQVPLRTRARVNIFRNWLFVTGNVGVQFGVTDPVNVGLSREGGGGQGGAMLNGNQVYTSETSYSHVEKYYTVAEAGAGFDFQISPRFKMYTTVSYVKGFTKLRQVDVTYQFAGEPEYSGSVVHEGSYLSFTYGLRYHFRGKEQ